MHFVFEAGTSRYLVYCESEALDEDRDGLVSYQDFEKAWGAPSYLVEHHGTPKDGCFRRDIRENEGKRGRNGPRKAVLGARSPSELLEGLPHASQRPQLVRAPL